MAQTTKERGRLTERSLRHPIADDNILANAVGDPNFTRGVVADPTDNIYQTNDVSITTQGAATKEHSAKEKFYVASDPEAEPTDESEIFSEPTDSTTIFGALNTLGLSENSNASIKPEQELSPEVAEGELDEDGVVLVKGRPRNYYTRVPSSARQIHTKNSIRTPSSVSKQNHSSSGSSNKKSAEQTRNISLTKELKDKKLSDIKVGAPKKMGRKWGKIALLRAPEENIIDYLVSTVAAWLERMRERALRRFTPVQDKNKKEKIAKKIELIDLTSDYKGKTKNRRGRRRGEILNTVEDEDSGSSSETNLP